MIVAVVAMLVVQSAVHQVVDMVTMRNGLVPAAHAVDMASLMALGLALGRASIWIDLTHLDHVLIGVIAVRMVKMAVVEIVNMVTVAHSGMATAWAMMMRVLCLGQMLGLRHGLGLL
ncbi:hypothetical protein [Bradyrhizobium sp. CER78]|uniref:hypothetical protein n=1 Tax=Bradyrhizobium sp. CER78 TaxID=3039162 RepID=UPI002446E8E6|nr:hypothetical protein [Bradyrhizobium sp. CER78]MDH2384858.1 hypothetical protein [Bradyrhizobium sp. CER78]